MKEFALKPTDMTREVMEMLEEKGCIYLLGAGRHDAKNVPVGSSADRDLYKPTNTKFGGHRLMNVTMNFSTFSNFGAHCECEDFLLLGPDDAKDMYIVVALMDYDAFVAKAARNGITEDDFVLLRCKFNDPECSFFTMRGNVPHGECAAPGKGVNPSFYVAEPSAMTTRFLLEDHDGIEGYHFTIAE